MMNTDSDYHLYDSNQRNADKLSNMSQTIETTTATTTNRHQVVESFPSRLAASQKFEKFDQSNCRSSNNSNNNSCSDKSTDTQEYFCWNRLMSKNGRGSCCCCIQCNNDDIATTIRMKTREMKQQQSTESVFYKFLGRFSGRRRYSYYHHLQRTFHTLSLTITSILILISLCSVTEACSSRTTPKPRPAPTPSPRPNITFHTYKCPPAYAAWYCLNEATCFTVKIGDEILYNCECADGYMGPRCEYKDLDGSYLPTRPRVMLETASIASGATLALILVLILCLIAYTKCSNRRKLERLAEDGELDVDTVDGSDFITQTINPFGPSHHRTIPFAADSIKR